MTETTDHKTANLLDMLTGRTYPEDFVVVHQDAAADYLIAQSHEQIRKLEAIRDTEGAKELQDKLDEYVKQAQATALTVHVKAISSDDRDLLVDAALAKYPEELDPLGRPKNNDDRNNYFTNLRWAAHITRIEGSAGSDNEIDVDKVVALRAVLPEYSKQAVHVAIEDLYQGSNEGYQQALQETAFSSAASLEA